MAKVLEALIAKGRRVRRPREQKEVAFGLCDLSTHTELHERIVALAGCEDLNAQRQAMSALRGLCITPHYRPLVVQEGVLDPIVLMARTDEIEVLREVSAALNCLSSVEENKMEICDRSISTIIAMLLSGDVETERHACCSVANLVELAELQDKACVDVLVDLAGGGERIWTRVDEDGAPSVDKAIEPAPAPAPGTGPQMKTTAALLMIAVARERDLQLRVLGVSALRHLSLSSRIKRPIVREGGLGPVYECLMGDRSDAANVDASVADMTIGTYEGLDLDLLAQCAGLLGNLAEDPHNQLALVRDGAFAPLVRLSRVPHAGIQMDVARALCSISAHPDNQVGVFGPEELQALFDLMANPEENCARDAAIAVGNLATVTKNQVTIVRLGALGPLIALLESQFDSCQQFSARALCRLSAHTANQPKVVDAGGLQLLIKACRSGAPEVRRFASMALCNVCVHEANKLKVVKLDGIRPLIDMLDDKDSELCRRYAAMALSNLTNEKSNQEHVVRNGAVLPLIRMAMDAEAFPECARFAGFVLCNLASNRMNRVPLVRAGALPPLVAMASREDGKLEVQRSAALALYNISCAAANQLALVQANATSALIRLCGSVDVDCKRFAIMSLSNLAANIQTRSVATKGGGLQAALGLLKDFEVDIRRYACICLGNMANFPVTQVQIIVHGGLQPLLDLCNDDDVDSQRQALMCLVNVTSNEANHPAVMSKGTLKVLMRLAADSQDAAVREYATFNVANLASDPDLLAQIGRAGGVPPLVYLSQSNNIHSQCLAFAALRRLTNEPENRRRFVQAGGLPSLASSGLSAELEIQREVAACLCNVTLEPSVRMDVAKVCLPAMVHLAQCGDREAARQAMGSLANLAVQIASLEDVECQEVSAFALAHLASDRDLQVPLVTLGALKPLVAMMSIQAEPRHYAGLALLKLADNFENHVAIAQEGGIQALLRLGRERTTDEELQYKAALTVGTLASNAVKMMPPTAETHGTGAKRMVRSDIGFGAAAMLQGRVAGEARKGREETLAYLEKTTAQDAASGETKKGG